MSKLRTSLTAGIALAAAIAFAAVMMGCSKEESAPNAKVLILGGTVGHQTGDARRKGVEDACKKAGMQVIFRPADWSDSKANEITQAELTAQPDLGAIFGACDPMILAAKQVVKGKGKLGQIVLVGFDGNKDAMKAVKAGEVDATVMQHPEEMGRQGLQLLVKILKGETVPANTPIAPTLIEKSNVDKYLDAPIPEAGSGQTSATAGKKSFTIAYVGFSSTTPFWITMKDAADKAARELDVTFKDLTAAKPEMDQQKAALDNAILSKVDGLLVGAVDSRGLKDTFDKAQKAGIPIVTVDTRVEHPAVRAHVATDNEAGAALAGEYIVKRLAAKKVGS
ncbi:MAG: sugar ABC transporter substrate-binding protein [Candidatus Sumerlaeota bacterium]|nr:sugar ABC transporter substrate-binding protein [Candidatus Sumerlaeota bacterium]